MFMKLLIITYLGFLIFFGCSSATHQTSENEQKEEDVYVFDDITNIDTVSLEKDLEQDSSVVKVEQINDFKLTNESDSVVTEDSVVFVAKKYFIQLGAFSTLENANNFVNDIQSQFNFPLEIFFNNRVNLFTVRTIAFDDRKEAEILRDNLKKTKIFSDAFIVTE